MQSTILVILSTWAVSSLSLSHPPEILPKSTLSQRTVSKTQQEVLKQPEAKTDFRFSALSHYKSSVETNFPIFAIAFSHYDHRANMS